MEPPAPIRLRVLVVDEDEPTLREVGTMVAGLGHELIACAVGGAEAAHAAVQHDPDVGIVAVTDPPRDLVLLEELAHVLVGPVVAVLDAADPDWVAAAARRGMWAYARPVEPHAIQSALELAVRRHGEAAQLAARVDQLESALERRAVIERAKGILMERHRLDERAAFELLRDHARSRQQRVVDLARSLEQGHTLLPARLERGGADERGG